MYIVNFYVPTDHFESVTKEMFQAGAGAIGNYDQCCWRTLGQGQFRPKKGSQPHIGFTNQLETVKEYKVELVCADDKLEAVIAALKLAHPYETPAFYVLSVK